MALGHRQKKPPGRFPIRQGFICVVLVGVLVTVLFSSSTMSYYLLQGKHSPDLNHISLGLTTSSFLSSTTFGEKQKGIEAPVVAYAITISGCSKSPEESHHHDPSLVDAAAVLQHSIHAISSRVGVSRYDFKMYAFIHPSAKHCAFYALEALGYEVQVRETPLNVTTEVPYKMLRKALLNQGCCGEKELLKFYSLQLTEHPIVVHMDLDSILLQPLDHLFDLMLAPTTASTPSERPKILEHNRQHLLGSNESQIIQDLYGNDPPKEITSMFTRDYAMVTPGIRPERVGMQGGFWVVKPNPTVFEEFMTTIKASNFVDGCGWGGCSIGAAWYYGAANFQGIVSYYYSHLQRKLHPTSTYVELDRCKYNNMADPSREGCQTGKDTVACNSCFDTPLADIHGAHFTLCQKPYWCPSYQKKSKSFCYHFHRVWHLLRQDWEDHHGSTGVEHLPSDFSLSSLWPQPPVAMVDSYEQLLMKEFPGHCSKIGEKNYIPMNLSGLEYTNKLDIK